jgi:hypothetical protein
MAHCVCLQHAGCGVFTPLGVFSVLLSVRKCVCLAAGSLGVMLGHAGCTTHMHFVAPKQTAQPGVGVGLCVAVHPAASTLSNG